MVSLTQWNENVRFSRRKEKRDGIRKLEFELGGPRKLKKNEPQGTEGDPIARD
jgi:hypothetical protein